MLIIYIIRLWSLVSGLVSLLTDVTRLNFFEVARAAFLLEILYMARGKCNDVARAGLVH